MLYGCLQDAAAAAAFRQCLDQLPAQAREIVMSVVAAYLPYYHPPEVSRPVGVGWKAKRSLMHNCSPVVVALGVMLRSCGV